MNELNCSRELTARLLAAGLLLASLWQLPAQTVVGTNVNSVPRIWVFHDEDPNYLNPALGDSLTQLGAAGEVLLEKRGFNIDQTVGGARAIATTDNGASVLVCEDVAGRLSKIDSQGNVLFSLARPMWAVNVASNGTIFALDSGGTIYGANILRLSAQGSLLNMVAGGGFDLAIDDKNQGIFVVGADIKYYNFDLVRLWTASPIVWTAVSVDVASDGSAWVAERQHPQVSGSVNRLLHISPLGSVLQTVGLSYSPWCVRVDRSDDSLYVGGDQLYKYDQHGALLFSASVGGSSGWSLAIDSTRQVWVGTWADVRKFSPEGVLLLVTHPFSNPSDTYVAAEVSAQGSTCSNCPPVIVPRDYFTEFFSVSANDLAFQTLTFTPDGSASFYGVCHQPATKFPVDPSVGTPVILTDDSYQQVTLSGSHRVSLYGRQTNVFFIGSNGYLTIGNGDATYTETLASHFKLPRIAALFHDLDPEAGGTISWVELDDRIAVTFQGVPDHAMIEPNDFQIELFFDGRIRLTYLTINSDYNLVGLSAGQGVPADFTQSDLDAYGSCPMPSIRYVDVKSANPTWPYTSWATAAVTIQDAVDSAVAGDEIVVTNGSYGFGGRATQSDSTPNRVVVDKPLTLRSINGPQSTIIDGGHAGRCVYLTNGATLSGFTLTNGVANFGAGLRCESTNALASNCVIAGNSSPYQNDYVAAGGGAYGGTLNHCSLSQNKTWGFDSQSRWSQVYGSGGGASHATLNNCTLIGNSAGVDGGGASGCTLNNCTLTGNWAESGGGASDCALNNCALTGNSADVGGGAWGGTLHNCTLTGNSASISGGGASRAASWNIGEATGSILNNCIVYFNNAPQGANYDASTLNYCCTAPLPTNGVGNISVDPQLASFSHIGGASPCREAGSAAYASGTDIDGEAWANPPSIGCDEPHPVALTGPLSAGITASFTNVAMGFPVQFTGLIEGRSEASLWDFGDGIQITNQPYVSHAWTAVGDYAVVLRTYNESQPGGVGATMMIHIVAGVHYVAADSANPVAPFTSWATAATNIQYAIDAAIEPGAQVVVTNGTYERVSVQTPLTVRSVNGPQFTTIDGVQRKFQCVYLNKGARLSGFALTNGDLGAYCESPTALLSNCVLAGNASGALGGTLNNCVVSGSQHYGVSSCTLNNCTLTGNGQGAFASALNNCIVYHNIGSNYDYQSTLNYCCTTPQPISGIGNISLDPQLASSSHLSSVSPCRGAGSAAYASGTDIDGEPWGSPPAIGCDECYPSALTGSLSVGIAAAHTNVAAGFPVGLTALIEGRTRSSVWDFGDGITLTNQPYISHAWNRQGDYAVILRAYNDSQPGGISSTTAVHVVIGVLYVAADNDHPVAPYTSWPTAATNIQDALDAAPPGGLVLVTNGHYATGGHAPNRVGIDKFVTLRSVNGPQFTIIEGGLSVRCAYVRSGATLSGFTLTNGSSYDGGGVLSESASSLVSNCVVTGCSANNGGGTYGDGTLRNCILTGNWASDEGGGAHGGNLNNCLLSRNAGQYGGGAYQGMLNNCTLTENSATLGGGGAFNAALNNCISFNNILQGVCEDCGPPRDRVNGNWFGDPLFVDLARGNLHLQSNSPCINAGNNAFAVSTTDLDGNPRIVGGTVDAGAYEFQSPTSMISYAWLQQFGLPIDGSADTADTDGDGLNNLQEWRCGTDPTNALSALRLFAPASAGTNVTVTWQSVAGVNYFLERSTDLTESQAFAPVAIGIPGQAGATTFTDTNANGAGPWFYRVGISTP